MSRVLVLVRVMFANALRGVRQASTTSLLAVFTIAVVLVLVGSASLLVANMTGIAPAQAWAFGDGLNDIEMFQWAGYSFAMENGHPELLSIADRVAPSHDADGIAVVLEDLLVS